MKIAEKKSAKGLNGGSIDSIVDAISDHVEKSENYEFVRIMEQYSKMDAATVKKFLECAPNLIMIDSYPVNMVTLLHSLPR